MGKKKTEKAENLSAPPIFKPYLLFLVILAGVLIYSNTFRSPFVFDDINNIVAQEGIHLKSFSLADLTTVGQTLLKNGRPVALASFALNYYFGGLDTFGYHLVNLFIHLLTAILVYFFISLTLNLPVNQIRYGKQAGQIALLGSLLFVVHPVQTQTVNYIVQRMTGMAAMFYLLSLTSYVKGRITVGKKNIIFYIVSAISALLAFGTKEHTITLPIIIVLYEYFFFRKLDYKWLIIKLGLLFVLFIAPMIIVVLSGRGFNLILDSFSKHNFTMLERVLTNFRVVVYYISLLLFPFPSRLTLDYDFPLSRSLFDPAATLISILVVIGLIFIASRIARKRPVLSFGIFWFLLTLLPETSVLPLALVFEHRLYLPSVGFLMLLSVLLIVGVDRLNIQNHIKRKIMPGFFFVLIVLLSIMTYQRNKVWQDDLVLWEDTVGKSPLNRRSRQNLAHAYEVRGRMEEAILQYQRVIELDSKYKTAHNGLGYVYLKTGNIDKAVAEFLEEIKYYPDSAKAYNNLGYAYAKQNRLTEALEQYQRTLEVDPKHKGVHLNLGSVYHKLGNPQKAVAALFKELDLYPNSAKAYNYLGYIYTGQRQLTAAMIQYQRALQINPDYTEAHNGLGNVYSSKGLYKEAESEFLEVIRLQPNHPKVHHNLGLLYAKQNLDEKAGLEFKKSLSQKHEDPETYNTLGLSYAEKKMYQEAIEAFQKAIDNNYSGSHKNLGNVYYLLKKYDEAIEEWKKALAVTPKDESLKKALDMAQREIK